MNVEWKVQVPKYPNTQSPNRVHSARPPLLDIWVFGCLGILLLGGCGESLPTTVPVTGKVTFKGEPLTDGTVSFHPQEIAEGLPKRTATGKLQADGSFTLSTFRTEDGAVPGTYRVTVHSYLSEPGSSNDDQKVGEYKWRIPPRYGDPLQSGLTADVSIPSGESLSLKFSLTDD